MHYHMQNEEYSKVVDACKRYGDQEICLWEQALGYFARKEEDCKAYISEVLQHIDQNNLMPPLLGKFPVSRCIVHLSPGFRGCTQFAALMCSEIFLDALLRWLVMFCYTDTL